MAEFRLEDLTALLRARSGVDSSVDLDADVLDTTFSELGYDSLAVLDLASQIERKYGIAVPDDAVAHLTTPRETIDFVNGQQVGHTDNTVVVNAPFDLVWTMTNDVEAWPELFSEYASAEILERDGDTVRFRLTMHPDDDGNAWSWVSERTVDREARSVRARRVEPGWFEHMDIRWDYTPVDGGVAMRWRQDFRMRPDSPVDDAGMTKRINENTAVQMERIRKLVEQAAADAPLAGVEREPA